MATVILVDHGSSYEEANRSVEELAEKLSHHLGMEVIATHMELAPPLFKELLETLAIHPQHDRILIVPLFISGGKHLSDDISTPIKELTQAFPGLKLELLPPLSEQPGFLTYLADLIRSHLQEKG